MKLDLFGWFPKENEELLAQLIREHKVKTVLEVGCFLGKSTKFFVDCGCAVTTIDTFKGADDLNGCVEVQKRLPTLYEQFIFNLETLGIIDRVTVLVGTSLEADRTLELNKQFDMVFIDGSHLYEDVRQDIMLLKRRAKKIICGDDYSPHHPGVREAVDELLPSADKQNRCWYLCLN